MFSSFHAFDSSSTNASGSLSTPIPTSSIEVRSTSPQLLDDLSLEQNTVTSTRSSGDEEDDGDAYLAYLDSLQPQQVEPSTFSGVSLPTALPLSQLGEIELWSRKPTTKMVTIFELIGNQLKDDNSTVRYVYTFT